MKGNNLWHNTTDDHPFMNTHQLEIYKALIDDTPKNVSLTQDEMEMLKAVSILWDTNPPVARVIEKGVKSLFNKLAEK